MKKFVYHICIIRNDELAISPSVCFLHLFRKNISRKSGTCATSFRDFFWLARRPSSHPTNNVNELTETKSIDSQLQKISKWPQPFFTHDKIPQVWKLVSDTTTELLNKIFPPLVASCNVTDKIIKCALLLQSELILKIDISANSFL